ncbi:MAG: hypothetical protein A4S09_02845 [Proteobacteria bacterium SG_bin7]|nr:MAG: hypothetical protein A4S09_02845 [Proteobacteria bacterium SG_bin7]
MNTKRKKFVSFLFAASLSSTSLAAVDDDESSIGFDSIVKDLTSSTSSIAQLPGSDPFDYVMIHFGVGLVNSYISYHSNVGPVSGLHQGFQATLGIDLFSKNWQAEGAVRTFSETEINNTRASLHEFDLKIIYTFTSYSSLEPYMGLGVAARYLDVTESGKVSKFTTPSSILNLGTAYKLSDGIAIAGEVSYRKPFIDETAERSAVDLALRLNTHF